MNTKFQPIRATGTVKNLIANYNTNKAIYIKKCA